MRPTIDFQALHFLIVEDNANMRRILRAILMGFGARNVKEVADGAEGLEALTANLYDVVLTDWMMPVIDGIEFTRMVRSSASSPNPFVPVIMITGHADKSLVARARDAGVSEFLVKPISPKALLDRVTAVVVDPRPFVRANGYFGPDRRRAEKPSPAGFDRRRNTTDFLTID